MKSPNLARLVGLSQCTELLKSPLSNPPFGVVWNTQQKAVTDEYQQRGFAGRFGPGLPEMLEPVRLPVAVNERQQIFVHTKGFPGVERALRSLAESDSHVGWFHAA
jgi:hypothetical protein